MKKSQTLAIAGLLVLLFHGTTYGTPDLVPEVVHFSAWGTVVGGEAFLAMKGTLMVSNIGDEACNSHWAIIFSLEVVPLENDKFDECNSVPAQASAAALSDWPDLAPGESTTKSFFWETPITVPWCGFTLHYKATVDSEDSCHETDEGNNVASGTWETPGGVVFAPDPEIQDVRERFPDGVVEEPEFAGVSQEMDDNSTINKAGDCGCRTYGKSECQEKGAMALAVFFLVAVGILRAMRSSTKHIVCSKRR